jgi:hypothetical protein
MYESTGASRENAVCEVPATAPSVMLRIDVVSANPAERHFTLVAVVQEAVLHSLSASLIEAVKSSLPKFRPRIDTDWPPLPTELRIA